MLRIHVLPALGKMALDENLTGGIELGQEAQRNRFLSREEAQRLVDAITVDENRPAADAILLLMLTGARRNEITQAKWEHVLWTERKLLVPLSKSGKPRWIALSTSIRSRGLRLRLRLPVADYRPAVAFAMVPMAAHPRPCGTTGAAVARLAAFVCELPGQ